MSGSPRGYVRASLVVLVVLVAISIWVATGHGLPGGSAYRRATGQEGPTGGLTTAMRHMLQGDFALGASKHRAAPWVFAFLVGQIAWRGFLVLVRPTWLPARTWIFDLIASFLLFGAAIYVPYWTR